MPLMVSPRLAEVHETFIIYTAMMVVYQDVREHPGFRDLM